jgi:hypothetical protein
MRSAKLKKLRSAGWKIGDVKDFLKLGSKESKRVDTELEDYLRRVKRGIAEANRGDFASDKEVKAVFRKFNVDY